MSTRFFVYLKGSVSGCADLYLYSSTSEVEAGSSRPASITAREMRYIQAFRIEADVILLYLLLQQRKVLGKQRRLPSILSLCQGLPDNDSEASQTTLGRPVTDHRLGGLFWWIKIGKQQSLGLYFQAQLMVAFSLCLLQGSSPALVCYWILQ